MLPAHDDSKGSLSQSSCSVATLYKEKRRLSIILVEFLDVQVPLLVLSRTTKYLSITARNILQVSTC